MEAISIPVTFGIVSFFLYKFFELLICRKERLNIVDKIDGNSIIEYLKQVRLGFNFGNMTTSGSSRLSYPASWSLRIGCLILGLGAGLIFACLLDHNLGYSHGFWNNIRESIYGGCVLCFGGLGMLAAFVVEYLLYRKACKENK